MSATLPTLVYRKRSGRSGAKMRSTVLLVGLIIVAWNAFSPVFYLVPYDNDTRSLILRMPSAYGMSGREFECELRAVEMRQTELLRYARCEAVPAWRHWLHLASVE
jgi:hypothetical protein